MLPWSPRFLQSTRGRIVRLLRERDRTVNDLAAALGVTPNAVRAHLPALEEEGLVRENGRRPGVRRPEVLYTLAPEADRLFARAYGLVLRLLLEALQTRLAPAELEAVLAEIGHQLGEVHRVASSQTFAERIRRATEVLNALGGLATVEEGEAGWTVHGVRCPLAELGAGHAEVCALAGALLEDIVGAPVRIGCRTEVAPRRCRFEVAA
jgi:DeoR family suf operon transcriptional repressor